MFSQEMMDASKEVWSAMKPFLVDTPITQKECDAIMNINAMLPEQYADPAVKAYTKIYIGAMMVAISKHRKAKLVEVDKNE